MSDEAANAPQRAAAERAAGAGAKSVRRGRRPRRRVVLVAALSVGLGFLAGLAAMRVPEVAAVTPANGDYVSTRSVTIRLSVSGLGGVHEVRMRLDGRDVSSRVSLSRGVISLRTGMLSDGVHRATLEASSDNPFRRHLRHAWRFTVDTSTPTLDLTKLQAEPVVTASPAVFAGVTEPYASVTVTSGSVSGTATADADGNYSVTADLSEGTHDTIFAVEDRAGNSSRQRVTLVVDRSPPKLSVERVAGTLRTTSVSLDVSASDAAATPSVAATLNGEAVIISGDAADGVAHLSGLPQGIVSLQVSATDKAGHVTTVRRSFLVDSTERFGAATLVSGARGADVTVLQKRLVAAGVLDASPSGVYDRATAAAVRRLEVRYSLTSDGVVGPAMLVVLGGRRIVVDLAQCRLHLYQGGRLIKTYRVATGQSAYPTPTGTFRIVEKVKNPTWNPPDSAWAEGATTVAAGESNPLGSRWMGLDASGVGIHGVPSSEDDSIGTHASHGCIRMHDSDAVDLFTRVSVNTPVVIRA
jgi:peptidoglycan hydrolase-like protein with peptidoglycan-binding domain